MTTKFNQKLLMAALFLSTILLNTSCNKDEDKGPVSDSYYSLGTILENVSYILSSDNLNEGSVSPVGNGVEFGAAEFIQSGNYIYFYTRAEKKFYQYELKPDGSVTEVAALLVTQYVADRAYSQNLVDENTILVLDPVQWGEPEIKWFTITIPGFTVSASGSFSLPTLEQTAGVNWKSNVGKGVVSGGKFYMGTLFYDFDGNFEQGSHAVVLDYPAMSNPTLASTTQVSAELGIVTNTDVVKDANGDVYFAAHSGKIWGKPITNGISGSILRIKSGQADFDDTYLLDLTVAIGDTTNIMQLDYTGSGKAIAMLFDDTQVADWDDLDNDHYFFATIDLATKAVDKLNVPKSACRQARRPLIDGGKYITYLKSAANSTTHVLTIDLGNGTYATGAQIEGNNVDGYSVAKHPAQQ